MSDFTPSPSLQAFAQYAREKAQDKAIPFEESELWARLADEIDYYCVVDTPAEQADLFSGDGA